MDGAPVPCSEVLFRVQNNPGAFERVLSYNRAYFFTLMESARGYYGGESGVYTPTRLVYLGYLQQSTKGTQRRSQPVVKRPCSDYVKLDDEKSDKGALQRLIFQEAGYQADDVLKPTVDSSIEYLKGLAAVAAIVHNRVAFLNSPGLKQSETLDFGNVGASIADVVYSRGRNYSGKRNIGTQFAGFTPEGISESIQNRLNRALNSEVDSPECLHLQNAIDTANKYQSSWDPFNGRTIAMRTRGTGSPFSNAVPLGTIRGNVYFGFPGR